MEPAEKAFVHSSIAAHLHASLHISIANLYSSKVKWQNDYLAVPLAVKAWAIRFSEDHRGAPSWDALRYAVHCVL
jgi:hypothetical protein